MHILPDKKGSLTRSFIFLCVFICLVLLPLSNVCAAVLLTIDGAKLLAERNGAIFVDARPVADFNALHIDGAVSIPSNETFKKAGRSDLVASMIEMRDLLNRVGVSPSSRLIVYGENNYQDISRVFWVLEMFGVKEAFIMNDSFITWQKRGYGIESGRQLVKQGNAYPALREEKLASMLMVFLAIDDEKDAIIDARSELEYKGVESKTGVYGHIPSAINIPWHDNLNKARSQFRSDEGLRRLYQGVSEKKMNTVYCNKGRKSALNYVALRQLGANVRAYDGSWYEWSLHPGLPREVNKLFGLSGI